MTTYTKLRDGSWGVRVQGTAQVGQTVTVAKRDGSSKVERIARVVWQGEGVTLASVEASDKSSAPSRSRRYGSGAGSAPAVPGYSRWCTDSASCRCYDCAS